MRRPCQLAHEVGSLVLGRGHGLRLNPFADHRDACSNLCNIGLLLGCQSWCGASNQFFEEREALGFHGSQSAVFARYADLPDPMVACATLGNLVATMLLDGFFHFFIN